MMESDAPIHAAYVDAAANWPWTALVGAPVGGEVITQGNSHQQQEKCFSFILLFFFLFSLSFST
jgi:hypothetical protein